MTNKRERYHSCYWKTEGQLCWWQYQQSVYRVWRWHDVAIAWRLLARCDRPMHILLEKAFGS